MSSVPAVWELPKSATGQARQENAEKLPVLHLIKSLGRGERKCYCLNL